MPSLKKVDLDAVMESSDSEEEELEFDSAPEHTATAKDSGEQDKIKQVEKEKGDLDDVMAPSDSESEEELEFDSVEKDSTRETQGKQTKKKKTISKSSGGDLDDVMASSESEEEEEGFDSDSSKDSASEKQYSKEEKDNMKKTAKGKEANGQTTNKDTDFSFLRPIVEKFYNDSNGDEGESALLTTLLSHVDPSVNRKALRKWAISTSQSILESIESSSSTSSLSSLSSLSSHRSPKRKNQTKSQSNHKPKRKKLRKSSTHHKQYRGDRVDKGEDEEEEDDEDDGVSDGSFDWQVHEQGWQQLVFEIATSTGIRKHLQHLGVDLKRFDLATTWEDSLDSALRVLSRSRSKLSSERDESEDEQAEGEGQAYFRLALAKVEEVVPCKRQRERGDTSGEKEWIAAKTQLILTLKEMLEADALVARFSDSLEKTFHFLQQTAGLEECGLLSMRESAVWKHGLQHKREDEGKDMVDSESDQRVMSQGDLIDFEFCYFLESSRGPMFDRFKAWERYGKNLVTLYAVRPACTVASILKHGFRPSSQEAPLLSVGRGLTFFATVKQALANFEERSYCWTDVSNIPLYVFAVRVCCGEILSVEQPEFFFDHAPKGYHSIFIGGKDGGSAKELCKNASGKFVVFDESQILPLSFARVST